MRQNKFRAWDKIEKEMTEWEELKDNMDFGKLLYNEYDEYDDFEVMQYTGLKDMNGVDIYEGDVISDNISMVGVVEFKNSAYRVNCKNNSCKWFIDYIESEIKTIEVIGNIYENKNLLEEK